MTTVEESDGAELVDLDVEGEPEPSGLTTRLIAAMVPLAIGAVALVSSYRLGIGTPTAPGAGLWPAGASVVVVVASVIVLIGVRRAADCERFGGGVAAIGLGVVGLGGFVVLFGGASALSWPGVGFEWSTAALLVFWLKVLGKESWRVTAFVTVAFVAVTHVLLIELLQAPIPHTIGW